MSVNEPTSSGLRAIEALTTLGPRVSEAYMDLGVALTSGEGLDKVTGTLWQLSIEAAHAAQAMERTTIEEILEVEQE